MEGCDKQDLRSTWRRRQQLNRRHGGRRGRGSGPSSQREGRGQRGQLVVAEQRDRYGDDSDESTGDDGGAREDYAVWLSACPKDSQELLRRSRVSLPDVHEYTRFVLETRQIGYSDDIVDDDDEPLDLEAIGACLRELPEDVMLGTRESAEEREILLRIVAGDPFVVENKHVVEPSIAASEESDGEVVEDARCGTDVSLADELDLFLRVDKSASDVQSDVAATSLEDDLAWFDNL